MEILRLLAGAMVTVLIFLLWVLGQFALEHLAGKVLGWLLRLVVVRMPSPGVVLWWMLAFFAGRYALEWWRDDPASGVRTAVTLLGCLVLAASGLAMTAAYAAAAAERRRLPAG